jgi:Sulfotransferase domain
MAGDDMLKVIGAGLPRTGTTSMKAALERLGFGPCYHMFEIFTHPDQVDRWLPVATDSVVDWDHVFEGYQSTQDWPASHFWRELADAYPEAKVVLTVRDPRAWHSSFRTLMSRSRPIPEQASAEMPAAMAGIPATIERLRPVLNLIGQAHFGPDWNAGDDLADEDFAVEAFNRHVARVRESVGSQRLLVFDVREGWEPLCSFLGVAPPKDEPFPRLNDSEWMRQAFEKMQAQGGLMPSPFVADAFGDA